MEIPFYSAGDGSFCIVPSQEKVRVVIAGRELIVQLQAAKAACKSLPTFPKAGSQDRYAIAYKWAMAIFNAALSRPGGTFRG